MTKQEIFYKKLVEDWCCGKPEYGLGTETAILNNKVVTIYHAIFRTAENNSLKIDLTKEEYDCLLEELNGFKKENKNAE